MSAPGTCTLEFSGISGRFGSCGCFFFVCELVGRLFASKRVEQFLKTCHCFVDLVDYVRSAAFLFFCVRPMLHGSAAAFGPGPTEAHVGFMLGAMDERMLLARRSAVGAVAFLIADSFCL